MRSNLSTRVLFVLAAVLIADLKADEKQDVAQLEQLISKIERLLPGGWDIAFEVSNDRWRRDMPTLVVKSREELPIVYVGGIGPPAANYGRKSGTVPASDIFRRRVAIELTFVPFVTPEEFAVARKKNEDLERQRRTYEERRLHQQQSQYKGGFSPASYQWQTGDRSGLVREYAFFWLRTEPQELPTHHFGTLAISTWHLENLPGAVTIRIQDEQRQQQYRQIMDGMKNLLVPYSQPEPDR